MKDARIPWWRRLSVRLAVVFVLTMLVFEFASPWLFDRVMPLVGAPTGVTRTVLEDGYDDYFGSDMGTLAPVLLADARRLDSGRVEPTPAAVERVASMLMEDEVGFLWLDADATVRIAHGESPWAVGESFDPTRVPYGEFYQGSMPYPVFGDGLEGWLVLLSSTEAVQFIDWNPEGTPGFEDEGFPEEYEVLDEESLAALEERAELVHDLVRWGLSLATAVLLGGVVSMLVTRRLRRLASAASEEGVLPAPFATSGSDEIGTLARARRVAPERAGRARSRAPRVDRSGVARPAHAVDRADGVSRARTSGAPRPRGS